jgi:aromatic-L-amino-acid decarboxylase
MQDPSSITPAQKGLHDMDVSEFRAAAHRVADMVADYLERLESYPVLPPIEPGAVKAGLPERAPAKPEPLDAILADYLRLIEPNVTHWQHPMFLAYFSSVASGPGILGEWLSAGLNSNVMLWRNAPASTELEEQVVSWLRQMLGLPDTLDGMLTDTASISSLLSIVAARHAVPGLDDRGQGLMGGGKRLRLYCSTEAHSSIDKGAITAGIGLAGVRKIGADAEFRMRVEELETAIRHDRASGWTPFCVVATAGTTSSTSVDPVSPIADLCEREKLWLHVDAAYAGSAALDPDHRKLFDGWERADSIVINPHKWMWTPFDASLLLFKRPEVFRDAFNLVPEYLKTKDAPRVHNFNEYGVQLGRRFRALKLWMILRYFGAEGMAARIREQCRLAQDLASWIDADPEWERLAPVPFSTVCFRYRPKPIANDEAALEKENAAILEAVNRTGKVFLSHTKLAGTYALRVALGNPRTTPEHVKRCWALLRDAAG